MSLWKNRLVNATSGQWTRSLIPNLEEWCNHAFENVNFHLTQAFTRLRDNEAWNVVSEFITLIMSGKETDERERESSGARADTWRLEADPAN